MTSKREQQIWTMALAVENDHGDAAEDHALAQAATAELAEEAMLWGDVAALLVKLHAIGRPIRKTTSDQRRSL